MLLCGGIYQAFYLTTTYLRACLRTISESVGMRLYTYCEGVPGREGVTKLPHLRVAPNDKMKDVLKRTISEARSAISKVRPIRHQMLVLVIACPSLVPRPPHNLTVVLICDVNHGRPVTRVCMFCHEIRLKQILWQ